MRTAVIQGHITATVKHSSFHGTRLLVAVPDAEDVAPQIVLDNLGAALGQRVIISSDGAEARQMLADDRSPARWSVLGIMDPERLSA